MLHAICHLGSSNLRLAVEPKRQIELLLLLRRYLLWLTMLMAFVHALCTRIGPPWQLQHTWIGVRSCAASTSCAMAARSCCTGATLLRFSIFPRTLTGCPSCQAFFRRCESQRVWPRIALVVRREGVGSSSRGSGPLPDGMCWWRPVYFRRWHGLELVPAANACQLRRCVRPRPASRLTMWRRSGATRVWLQPMIFGKCGGYGNKASDAGGNQHMSPWQGERQRSATLWPGPAAHYGFGWALSRQASRTSILLAQPVDFPLCSCATYATASCALIAPGRAELATLSRLALALLGAGLVLPSGTSVQTMDKDGLGRLWGARGPKQCPFGWLVGELPMASAWTRTLPLLSAVWRKRLEMRVQKWRWLGSRLGHAPPRGTAWRWSTQPRWLGGRSAKLLALLCPGGISRCRSWKGPPAGGRRPAQGGHHHGHD